MYIYSKIKIQTNTHIPITPSPHRKLNSSPTHTKHIYTQKKYEVGILYSLLTTQMKRIRLMYATVGGGTVCNWKSNIKHRMECP